MLRIAILILSLSLFPPLGHAYEAEAKRSFGGLIEQDNALLAAKAAAGLKCLDLIMRDLAQSKLIHYAGSNDGRVSFLPPNFEGLVSYLHRLEIKVDESELKTQTLIARAEAMQIKENLRKAIVDALKKPDLMDRYGALYKLQLKALEDYDTIASALLKESRKPSESGFDLLQLNKAVNSLRAIDMLATVLRDYDGTWVSPEREAKRLEEALVQGPANPLVLGMLAELYVQMGKNHEAYEMIVKALDNGPFYAFLHDIKGVVLLRQHLPSLSAQAFTEAVKLSPRNPMYRMHRASAYLVQGEQAGMCLDFRTACVLGDCTGYQWAREQGRCRTDESNEAKPLKQDMDETLGLTELPSFESSAFPEAHKDELPSFEDSAFPEAPEDESPNVGGLIFPEAPEDELPNVGGLIFPETRKDEGKGYFQNSTEKSEQINVQRTEEAKKP